MVNLRRTQYTFLVIILAFYLLSVAFTVLSGAGLWRSFVINAFDGLQVNYSLTSFSASANPYILTSKLLDVPILPLITVVFAAWFFDLINNMNIREKLVLSKIKKLEGHVIVVPYDNFAKGVIRELKDEGLKTVTITNNKKELLQLYRENELALHGDLRSLETFELANIDKAKCVVACSKDDILNALICITAKANNSKIKIISRVNKEEDIEKLEKAGAYKIIFSENSAGTYVGNELVKRILTKKKSVV